MKKAFMYYIFLVLALLGCHHEKQVERYQDKSGLSDIPEGSIETYNFNEFLRDVEDKKNIPLAYIQGKLGIDLNQFTDSIYGNSNFLLETKQRIIQLNGFVTKSDHLYKKSQIIFILFSDDDVLLDYEVVEIKEMQDCVVNYFGIENNKFSISFYLYTGKMPNLIKDSPQSKRWYSITPTGIEPIAHSPAGT